MVRLQTLEEELKKCPQLRLEDVRALREWAAKQPHFPNLDSYLYLCQILRRRYYSLERSKQTLDNFMTFKTLVPEMYDNKSTTSPDVKTVLNTQHFGTTDHTDFDGNLVAFHIIYDPDASKYDFPSTIKTAVMLAEAWVLEHGTANGLAYVFDHSVYSFAHLLRLQLTSLKKATYFNKECSPLSIKKVFIINATPVVKKALTVFGPLLEDEVYKNIKVFKPSETEEILKYLPEKVVPKDYGGIADTMEVLHKKAIPLMEHHEEYLKEVEALKVDELKRCGPERNMNTVFGLEGTFKQLNVD